MYIGHYGAAAAILATNHTIPVLPVAIGVAYPDLLWPIMIYLKKERVKIDPNSPLQKTINFISYPYSHSLIRSAFLTLLPAAAVATFYQRPLVGVYFWLASMSHWFLDIVMHLPDLPILGFGKDKKIGLGLWRYPKTAFIFEYVFYAVCILLFATHNAWLSLLAGGLVLHALNANSFFAFTRKNPSKSENEYASLALLGFGAAIAGFTLVWR